MNTLIDKKKVYMANRVATHLAFRHKANDLFDFINQCNEKNIELDFSDVITMSGSFAHQYLINKENSKKIISEINMKPNIKKMLDVVQKRNGKPKKVIEPPEAIDVII